MACRIRRSREDTCMTDRAARRLYNKLFFRGQGAGSRSSAHVIIPMMLQLLRCNSVVDVGCGIGTWLAVFSEHGVAEYLGIDGEYVNRSQLEIQSSRFLAHDLTRPLPLDRRFDLAICTEVAEHLPPSADSALIEILSAASDQILFSAAIPHQGGTGHINCRWQSEWVDRFRERGYVPVDCVRPVVWNDQRVDFWYAQNLLLYVKPAVLETNEPLRAKADATNERMFDVVHPGNYLDIVSKIEGPLGQSHGVWELLGAFPLAIRNAVARRVSRSPSAPHFTDSHPHP